MWGWCACFAANLSSIQTSSSVTRRNITKKSLSVGRGRGQSKFKTFSMYIVIIYIKKFRLIYHQCLINIILNHNHSSQHIYHLSICKYPHYTTCTGQFIISSSLLVVSIIVSYTHRFIVHLFSCYSHPCQLILCQH